MRSGGSGNPTAGGLARAAPRGQDRGAGLLRVTPARQWLEWQDWAHPVLAHPSEVRSGELHLPGVPGNGLEWDEDAVAHYQAR